MALPRAQAERDSQERRLAFEVLMGLVDHDDIDQDSAFSILREWSPTVAGEHSASVYQANLVARLERSIDSARGGEPADPVLPAGSDDPDVS